MLQNTHQLTEVPNIEDRSQYLFEDLKSKNANLGNL